MSTDRVEVNPDATPNPSIEEQAKQQTVNATSENDTNVEVSSVDNTNKSTDETRPSWLPEKFSNAEELAKAYGALETKLSQQNQEPSQQEMRKLAEAQEIAESNDMNKYYNEYAETGEISEKSYDELNKLGLNKDLVDGYIEGQKAIADNDVRQVHNVVGGEENYKQLLDWSSNNLNEAEKTAFNDMLDTGTIEQVKLAVSAIANRAGISGEKPQMLEGDTTSSNPEIFESVAQVTSAMNDPRYESDPAYRKSVEEKIARSSVL